MVWLTATPPLTTRGMAPVCLRAADVFWARDWAAVCWKAAARAGMKLGVRPSFCAALSRAWRTAVLRPEKEKSSSFSVFGWGSLKPWVFSVFVPERSVSVVFAALVSLEPTEGWSPPAVGYEDGVGLEG